jgi:hypothetical protein
MRTLIATLVVAVLVAPVAAFAAAPSGDAAKSAQADCTALKAKMGATAFTQAYSTFGSCVSKLAPVEQQSITSAQATCTAKQVDTNFASTHGGKTFDQFYGTGKKASNSFGNCVSSISKASSQTERQNRLNPAQTCRASRTQMGTPAFNALYRNFGACVSKVAKAQNQNESSASASCKTEQDAGQAAFDQKYANFGACVSGAAKEASATQQQATVSAAKQCYSQLKADSAAFKAKYHTFGTCVSQTAKS